MSNTPKSQVIVTGQIADSSGHTDFIGSLDEAIEMIVEQSSKSGKWAYINGTPFMFQNHGLDEQDELRKMLANADEPNFMLTARLQGGDGFPFSL